MGNVIIQAHTTKNPISLIGEEAGVCWGADITDTEKNYKRGLSCLSSGHGRTFEFPDVYMILDGYSARVIREWYTHIGGSPTRLQASTRYIDYEHGFFYVTPESIEKNEEALKVYDGIMSSISDGLKALVDLGITKEDAAMALPLGMTTKIVCKHNLRNLIDMSHQRMCRRAYWEYREMFYALVYALREYSDEWQYVVDTYFEPKCLYMGKCTEHNCCGRIFQGKE